MVDELYIGLLKQLASRTEKVQALWVKGTRESEFRIHFKTGTLVIEHWFGPEAQKLVYGFQVYNSKGEQIFSSGSICDGEPAFTPMERLHEIVKRRYYKVDETIASFLREAGEQGTIGEDAGSSRSVPTTRPWLFSRGAPSSSSSSNGGDQI